MSLFLHFINCKYCINLTKTKKGNYIHKYMTVIVFKLYFYSFPYYDYFVLV